MYPISYTKRPLFTREEVLESILVDCEPEPQQSDHGDLDDTMGPMAEGSDDDFMELDKEEDTWFSSPHHSPHTTVLTSSHDLPETQLLGDSSTSSLELTEYVDKK